MGYLVEVYGFNWTDLNRLLGCGNRAAVDRILERQGGMQGGGGEASVDWKHALEELVMGDRGRSLAARGVMPQMAEFGQTADAMALVAAVRTFGARAGEVVHTTRGGNQFRWMMLTAGEAVFHSRIPLMHLVSRPLFGLNFTDYPSWGGLMRSEIAELLGGGSQTVPQVPDAEWQVWLDGLLAALQAARSMEKDVISLYL